MIYIWASLHRGSWSREVKLDFAFHPAGAGLKKGSVGDLSLKVWVHCNAQREVCKNREILQIAEIWFGKVLFSVGHVSAYQEEENNTWLGSVQCCDTPITAAIPHVVLLSGICCSCWLSTHFNIIAFADNVIWYLIYLDRW